MRNLMNIQRIIHHESFSGGLLVFAAVFAMVLANSPGSAAYQGFLGLPVEVSLGNFEIAKPLILWVNDGLMALFFLLIGLEIKRELLVPFREKGVPISQYWTKRVILLSNCCIQL